MIAKVREDFVHASRRSQINSGRGARHPQRLAPDFILGYFVDNRRADVVSH
jgi:hypothetical protein